MSRGRFPSKAVRGMSLHIHPQPTEKATRCDYFGNSSVYFEIEGSHESLEITAQSLVRLQQSAPVDSRATPAWELVRDACLADQLTPTAVAGELCFASPLIPMDSVFAAYAKPSFPPGRPILEGVKDLNRRIFKDFAFDPTATDFATPVAKVLQQRRGVCQDFAQVMAAGLRSLGLAGPLCQRLPCVPRLRPGKPRLVGADASHAWVSVWTGADEVGWTDVDPTNDVRPVDVDHITVGLGA
ncbi:MAG: transglutaminase family protein [Gemmatimonadales bacterium]